jgi:hypothetical protein
MASLQHEYKHSHSSHENDYTYTPSTIHFTTFNSSSIHLITLNSIQFQDILWIVATMVRFSSILAVLSAVSTAIAFPFVKTDVPVTSLANPFIFDLQLAPPSVSSRPTLDWNSAIVKEAREIFSKFRRNLKLVGPDTENTDLLHGIKDVDKVPTSIIGVLKDMKHLFKKKVQPTLVSFSDELPGELVSDLAEPLEQVIYGYSKMINQLPSDTNELEQHLVRRSPNATLFEPSEEMKELMMHLISKLKNQSLKSILTKVVSVELTWRVASILKPIITSFIDIAIHDLRDIAKYVTKSLATGVDKDIWLPEVRKRLAAAVRRNAVGVLAETKDALEEHLPEVIMLSVITAFGIPEPLSTTFRSVFGDAIARQIRKWLLPKLDKLAKYLHKVWGLDESEEMVREIIDRNSNDNPDSTLTTSLSAEVETPSPTSAISHIPTKMVKQPDRANLTTEPSYISYLQSVATPLATAA